MVLSHPHPENSASQLSRARPAIRQGFVALLVAAGYYGGAALGFLLTPAQNPVSTLWPPNAILMAALLLTPQRTWWILLAAVFPAHLLIQLPAGVPLPTALGWFATNVAEALIGAACLRPYVTATSFLDSVHQIKVFVVFAGIIAPLATSFLDAGVVVGTGWSNDYWHTFRMRLFANVLSNLTVVPAVVTIASGGVPWLKKATLARYVEVGALAASTVLVARFAFGGTAAAPSTIPALIYTPLPLLLWASVRFGPGGLSTVLLLFALLSIWNAIHGRGPFTSGSVAQNVLALQVFFILITVPLLTLAAVIRERRRAEEALRESEEWIGLGAESAKLGFWSWDPSTPHVWATEQCRRMFGLSPDEQVTWETFVEATQPEERRVALQALGQAQADGVPYAAEYQEVLADGSTRWIEERARVLHAHDKSTRVTGVVIDVTERKRAELEVEEQRREVTHLTRVAMLGELSGALAHELNQPLTAILSNAQTAQRLLDRTSIDLGEVREILRDIVDDDRRAGQVIKRLRALLRKGDTQFQPLDLNEVLQDVLELDHSDLVARNVRVTTSFASDLPRVRGDRVQLQQLLLNLILNACEAMSVSEPSDRRLTITTALESDDSVEVSVADRGDGVRADRPEQLFEPFFTTKEKGLGLGLTICRSIILAHGGHLWVTNNPDRGATFHVGLPAHNGGCP